MGTVERGAIRSAIITKSTSAQAAIAPSCSPPHVAQVVLAGASGRAAWVAAPGAISCISDAMTEPAAGNDVGWGPCTTARVAIAMTTRLQASTTSRVREYRRERLSVACISFMGSQCK